MKKILIIEDEWLIARSLKTFLERLGHTVETTESGVDALSKILTIEYDRIVCDLMLQDISGFDVLEESRKKFSAEEISKKFLIMTAYSSPQVLEKAQEYKCPVLNKPFENIQSALKVIIGENEEKD